MLKTDASLDQRLAPCMCLPGGVAAEHPVAVRVGRSEVVAGRSSELAHGLVQGEESLPQTDRDDLGGHGDVVPGQPDEVFDVLAEDDDQDGGSPIAHGELVGVHHAPDGYVLF
ncbi:hypothetical protein [Nonomuraea sp. B19D2]|uniref:hypothetical protein n=1 Tax=Nonomuraea sp. B19D2 TaxID=3159561 RepID=UPI0032D9F727